MLPSRFWKNVDKTSSPDGCWLWTGCKTSFGYGQFSFKGRSLTAHRWVGIEKFGSDACDGMFVCHSCDVPACVNPDHLWLGTPLANMEDMVRKGRCETGDNHHARKRPEEMARGEDNGSAKLSEEQVIEIKRRYCPRTPGVTRGNVRQLAQEFGVTDENIRLIGQGKTWKHLDRV